MKMIKKLPMSELNPLNPIEFKIRQDSSISPEQQLIGHLKIAMMLGTLKPGQPLPSVRQMESQTGVGRNVIWRAYSKLAESGALTIEKRRRAVVSSDFHPEKAAELVQLFDWLGRDVLERMRALRISPQSFLRFLNHRTQNSEMLRRDIVFVECNQFQSDRWAGEIAGIWELLVPGVEIRTLKKMKFEERMQFKTVLTPLYHHEEVLELFRNPYTQVVPLRLAWNSEVIEDLESLPKDSVMAFILEESECAGYGDPLARELNAVCPNLHIQVISWKSSRQVKTLIESGKISRALLSGIVLEAADDSIRNSPVVVQKALEIDRRSLEEARIHAGVVL